MRRYTTILLVILAVILAFLFTRQHNDLTSKNQTNTGLISDQTIDQMSAAIELAPDNPELYLLRGQVYLSLYEWDKALADYDQALELKDDYAEAYFGRGLVYISILQTGTENYPLALADFQRYLELAPEGDHAEEALRYIEQLQAQNQALRG